MRAADEQREASVAADAADVLASRPPSEPLVVAGRIAWDEARVAHVHSPVTGKVASVLVELGARVARRQPLAMIASPDVVQATTDVHKAQADAIAAEHDFRRQRELNESQRDVEAAEDGYRAARATLARAKAKAALFGTLGVDTITDLYPVTSPIAGTVLAIPPVGLEEVGPSPKELFLIANLGQLPVVFDLPVGAMSLVAVGSPVTVHAPAFPGRTFDGHVDAVTHDAEAPTAKVHGVVDNRDAALRPEMEVSVVLSR
jgi:membrane fusion protein, heavy metal efflux system